MEAPPSFPLLAVRLGRPGKIYHVSDVKGRQMVGRLEMNVGAQGLRAERRANVPYTYTYLTSMG